jgi:hypothetical protein
MTPLTFEKRGRPVVLVRIAMLPSMSLAASLLPPLPPPEMKSRYCCFVNASALFSPSCPAMASALTCPSGWLI